MLLILLSSLISSALANQVSFEKGHDLQSVALTGQVTVICNGFAGHGQNSYTCRDIALEPQAYDFLIGPRDASADEVRLISKQEGGTVVKKSEEYDGRKGRSLNAFNLWISTIFQKPLLRDGRNVIDYAIYADGSAKYTGQITVQVNRGRPRTCPNATYNSIDFNDCQAQYSICQRYFKEYNNCKKSGTSSEEDNYHIVY